MGVPAVAADIGGRDVEFMRRGLALARQGWGQTAPNPMVGAVVVADGTIVGEGFHARYGEAHAEVVALHRAGERARGATVYVTLEPCAHFGKTPPCADALIAAGVSRVVISAPDQSLVARGGAARLRRAGIAVEIGLLVDESAELNAAFFNGMNGVRPWVTLKLAVSADGAIADPSGVHRWISGPQSRAEVHRMRANSDAIAVGVNTVIADDPSLTVRDTAAPRVAPKRVVFDSTLRTPRSSKLMRSAREVETMLIGRLSAVPVDRLAMAEEAGVTVMLAPSLHESLEMLRQRDIRSLLVEGGARLAGSLLRDDLVDRLVIFQSSLELGPSGPRAFAFAPDDFEAKLRDLPIAERRALGGDVMTTYALHDIPCLRV